MVNPLHRFSSAVVTSGALALMGAGALVEAAEPGGAASQSLGEGKVIEEIVVTARRRDESLQDVPVAVTALTAEDLRTKNVSTISELALATPSLTTTNVFAATDVNFSMRGQSAENNNFDPDQPVEVYFADVPLMAPTLGQFYDLESVQVLRGPQGTLFGRASNGGAVLLAPARPGSDLDGYVSAKLGNFDSREVEGGITFPVSETISVRLSGSDIRRDGYTRVLNLDDYELDDLNSSAARLSVVVAPNDAFENHLVYDYVNIEQHAGSWFLSAARPGELASIIYDPANPLFQQYLAANPALADIPGFSGGLQAYLETVETLGDRKLYLDTPERLLTFENETHVVANTTTVRLGQVTIKNIFGYQEEELAQGYSADGVPFSILQGIDFGTFSPTHALDRHQISDEIQLLGEALDGRWQWLVGGYYQKLEDDEPGNTLQGGALLVFGGAPYTPTSFERESRAVFTQHTVEITPRLRGTIGFRHTWDDNLSQQYAAFVPVSLQGERSGDPVCRGTSVPFSLSAPECLGPSSDLESDGSNWTISVDYDLTQEMLTYASVRTGYRGGGISTTSTVPFLREFDEETLTEVELGVKSEFEIGSGRARVNAAFYRQWIDDLQRGLLVFNPVSGRPEGVVLNAKESSVTGVELEAQFAPNAYWSFEIFGDYIDAKYDEFTIPEIGQDSNGDFIVTGTIDVSGNPFPNVPEYHIGGTVRVAIPLAFGFGELDVSLSYYHQDDYTFAADLRNEPEGVAPSYDVVNARIDWRQAFGGNVDVGLFATNLFDEEYVRGGISIQRQLGLTHVTHGEPRMYGLELRYPSR